METRLVRCCKNTEFLHFYFWCCAFLMVDVDHFCEHVAIGLFIISSLVLPVTVEPWLCVSVILQRLGPQTDSQCGGPAHVSGCLRFWLWRLPQPLAELRVAQCIWDVASCNPGCHGSPGRAEGCHRALPHATVLLTGKDTQDHPSWIKIYYYYYKNGKDLSKEKKN